MAKKVLLTQPIHSEGIKLLTDNEIKVDVSEKPDEEYLITKIKDYDGIIVRVSPLTKNIIDAAKKCIVIGRHGVGLDNIDVVAATRNNIPVVYAPGSNSNAVAEHAVCLMMAVAKQIWDVNVQLRNNKNYDYRLKVRGTELKEKTLGLIGLGSIGRKVAAMCQRGFSMKIIGYDPYINKDILEKEGLDVTFVNDIDYLLKNSDYISLHLPATKENEKMIGRREISLMKKTAILVNTSRGPLIDETALYEALTNRLIAGAGLDVFDPEPPLPDNPIFKLNNVIVTPHTAAHTEETLANMSRMVCENVLMVLKGQRPNNMANPEIWEKRRVI
jgi:D-3-phosphoglycerate dehydrogenase